MRIMIFDECSFVIQILYEVEQLNVNELTD